MPKIVFYKLVPVTRDVPDHCPKCKACLHGALLDENGAPVTPQTQYATGGSIRNGCKAKGPLNGTAWDASDFTGRLTGADGEGDLDTVIESNSLQFCSLPRNPIKRIECSACGWAVDPDEEAAEHALGYEQREG